jgi:hypothetical protein
MVHRLALRGAEAWDGGLSTMALIFKGFVGGGLT